MVQKLRAKLPGYEGSVARLFSSGARNPPAERAVLAKANEIASRLADGTNIFYLDINLCFCPARWFHSPFADARL